jgi:hypothetical protein
MEGPYEASIPHGTDPADAGRRFPVSDPQTSPGRQGDTLPCGDRLLTPEQNCTELIVKTVGEATTSILARGYAFTSAPIATALVDAKPCGVHVEAILDKSNRTETYSAANFLLPYPTTYMSCD